MTTKDGLFEVLMEGILLPSKTNALLRVIPKQINPGMLIFSES
jgi:hypothetical protein